MFENSRTAEADSDVNDLIQQSSTEFQSAFGSTEGGGLSVSVPVHAISVDTGGQREKTSSKAEGERKSLEGYKKESER